MDQKLRNELIRDECLGGKPALVSYQDTNGLWTIGIGHLVGKENRITRVTLEESDAFYLYDVEWATNVARSCIPYFALVDSVRQRALINMAFNRGNNMVTSSTITPAINRALANSTPENWEKVTDAIHASPWAAQVGDRANRLAKMLETGVA